MEIVVGGRAISVVKLREPLRWRGFEVACLELPAPKEGRAKTPGWEHLEVALGEGGVRGAAELKTMMARHPGVHCETKSLAKAINPEVSVDLGDGLCCKFHNRPLLEVVAVELSSGEALAAQPPPGVYTRRVRVALGRHRCHDDCDCMGEEDEQVVLAPGMRATHQRPPAGCCHYAPAEYLLSCGVDEQTGAMALELRGLDDEGATLTDDGDDDVPPRLRWYPATPRVLECGDGKGNFVRSA